MNQAHISKSLAGLDQGLIKKYNLVPYTNFIFPAIFMGMYREEDFNLFSKHIGGATIIWFGSDSIDLREEWVDTIN